MYAAIRQYRVDPDSSAELIRLIEEGFAPLLREVPGLVAYYLLEADEGIVVTIIVCEDQTGVEESAKVAEEWVKENLKTLFDFRPKNTKNIFGVASTVVEGILREVVPGSQNGRRDVELGESRRAEASEHSENGDGLLSLLSVEEVCTILGMGKSWVYRRLRNGKIPSIRLGHTVKVKRADLEKYLENNRQRPGKEE